MADREPGVETLIQQAQKDPQALGRLFERYRPFLVLVGQREIGPKLAVLCDPSDVAQQTLTEAFRAFTAFRGSSEPEFSAWIRSIHRRNLTDLVRKRVPREGPWPQQIQPADGNDTTASFCWMEPAAADPSPSRHWIEGEKALRLAELLQSLPEFEREAVRLRHLEGWPVQRIAEELDRSVLATAGLLKRGLKRLRAKMPAESWS